MFETFEFAKPLMAAGVGLVSSFIVAIGIVAKDKKSYRIGRGKSPRAWRFFLPVDTDDESVERMIRVLKMKNGSYRLREIDPHLRRYNF